MSNRMEVPGKKFPKISVYLARFSSFMEIPKYAAILEFFINYGKCPLFAGLLAINSRVLINAQVCVVFAKDP